MDRPIDRSRSSAEYDRRLVQNTNEIIRQSRELLDRTKPFLSARLGVSAADREPTPLVSSPAL